MSAKEIHDLDQLIATARLQAGMLAAYVNELRTEHKFTRQEALTAGIAWAVALVGMNRQQPGGGE